MFKTLLCDENNQFLVVEDMAAISDIVKRKQRHLWLDLERPSPEEIQAIQEEFGLHPLAIEDATMRHQRPKIEQYERFYFVVFYSITSEEPGSLSPSSSDQMPGRRGLSGARFHVREADSDDPSTGPLQPDQPLDGQSTDPGSRSGEDPATLGGDPPKAISLPTPGPGDERIVLREISMFMGENYLITVHEDPIPELDEVARRWFRNVEDMAQEVEGNSHVPGARPLTPGEEQNLKPKARDRGSGTGDRSADKSGPRSPHPQAGTRDPRSPFANLRVYSPPDEVEEDAVAAGTQTSDIGILLYSLLDTIVDGYFPVIDSMVDKIEDLEEQIFEQYNQAAIQSIFILKKDLLALRKVVAPERDVLNVLTRRDIPIFEQHTLVYFQDVYDHVVRITDSIDTYRDLLSSALDSFLSMQSNRLNVTVQTLTSVSIMLMSIAMVTGWYGMNFEHMPELASRFGYPGVVLVVAVIITIEFLYFRRKGWL